MQKKSFYRPTYPKFFQTVTGNKQFFSWPNQVTKQGKLQTRKVASSANQVALLLGYLSVPAIYYTVLPYFKNYQKPYIRYEHQSQHHQFVIHSCLHFLLTVVVCINDTLENNFLNKPYNSTYIKVRYWLDTDQIFYYKYFSKCAFIILYPHNSQTFFSYYRRDVVVNPLMLTVAKSSRTILMKTCRQKHFIEKYLMEKC